MVIPSCRWLLALTALLAVCSGCRPAEHKISTPPGTATAIVFIPGFKGTALAEADNGRIWLTASQAFFGRATLADNGAALGIPDTLELRTDGLLKRITVIPGIYDLDVYDSWMRRLRERFPGIRLVEFSYDWRAEPMAAVRALHRTVAGLRAEGFSVILLAHSFGGLISSYYLRYGEQDPESAQETWDGARAVRKVVLAGVPFRGAINKFRDMQQGEAVGFNRTLLDAMAHSSFAASYYLLPAPLEPALVTERLEPVADMLYDGAKWQAHRWGLFRNVQALPDRDRAARLAFVSTSLDRARTFSQLLFAPLRKPVTPAPQMINVIGRGRPTPARAIWRPDSQELGFNSDERLHAEGDGVVTVRSATLPPAFQDAFRPATFRSLYEHGELWSDPQVQDVLFAFLTQGEITLP